MRRRVTASVPSSTLGFMPGVAVRISAAVLGAKAATRRSGPSARAIASQRPTTASATA